MQELHFIDDQKEAISSRVASAFGNINLIELKNSTKEKLDG